MSDKTVIDKTNQAISADLNASPHLTEAEAEALFMQGLAEIVKDLRAVNQSIVNTADETISSMDAHRQSIRGNLNALDQDAAIRQLEDQMRDNPSKARKLFFH